MLVEVVEQRELPRLEQVLPADLPEPFTTLDLALALEVPRALAQRIAYTLRVAELIEVVGRRGRGAEYQRAQRTASRSSSAANPG